MAQLISIYVYIGISIYSFLLPISNQSSAKSLRDINVLGFELLYELGGFLV